MALKIEHFPCRLFRFGKFDEKGFWEAPLLKHQLRLSSPRYFNDPFDCAFVMDPSIIEAPHFTEMIYQSIQKYYPDFYTIAKMKKLDGIRELLNFFISYLNENSSGNFGYHDKELSLEQIIEGVFNILKLVPIGGLKVLCFSEVYDSLTMWGHYADNHRGFCISYDFMSDPRQRTRGKGIPLYPNIWPVIYQSQRVDFGELCKQGKIRSVTNAALFKSPLGANVDMSEKNIKRILNHANNIGIPVFKMELSNNAYKLIAVPINSPAVLNI